MNIIKPWRDRGGDVTSLSEKSKSEVTDCMLDQHGIFNSLDQVLIQ